MFKESEERQILVIKNQQHNAELRIGLLNDKLQEDEKKIEQLQEEKNDLDDKLSKVKDELYTEGDNEVKKPEAKKDKKALEEEEKKKKEEEDLKLKEEQEKKEARLKSFNKEEENITYKKIRNIKNFTIFI